MESDIETVKPAAGLEDHLVSLLGGISIGATAWAIAFGAVAVIKAAASKGINTLDVISGLKLTPPPGVDLSNFNLSITLPESQVLDISFIAVPILFGILVAWISYRKVLNLE